MMGRQSFEIRTARQFLEGLVEPDYDEFLQDRGSSRLGIHCALGCWHLSDWVWEDVLNGSPRLRSEIDSSIKGKHSFQAYAVKTCPDLGIVRVIANGSKHFTTGSSIVKDTKRAGTFQATAFQSTGFDIAQLKVDGRPFADILKAAVTFWQTFFRNHVSLTASAR